MVRNCLYCCALGWWETVCTVMYYGGEKLSVQLCIMLKYCLYGCILFWWKKTVFRFVYYDEKLSLFVLKFMFLYSCVLWLDTVCMVLYFLVTNCPYSCDCVLWWKTVVIFCIMMVIPCLYSWVLWWETLFIVMYYGGEKLSVRLFIIVRNCLYGCVLWWWETVCRLVFNIPGLAGAVLQTPL